MKQDKLKIFGDTPNDSQYITLPPLKCKKCPFKDNCAGGLSPTSFLGNAAIHSCTRKVDENGNELR